MCVCVCVCVFVQCKYLSSCVCVCDVGSSSIVSGRVARRDVTFRLLSVSTQHTAAHSSSIVIAVATREKRVRESGGR